MVIVGLVVRASVKNFGLPEMAVRNDTRFLKFAFGDFPELKVLSIWTACRVPKLIGKVTDLVLPLLISQGCLRSRRALNA